MLTSPPSHETTPCTQVEYQESYDRTRNRVHWCRVAGISFAITVWPLTSLMKDLLGRFNATVALCGLTIMMAGLAIYVSRIWKCPRCQKSLRKDMKDKLCRGCGMNFE